MEDNAILGIPNNMQKTVTVLTCLLLFTVLAASSARAGWLVYHKPEFKGQVIDAETKEPIEGAVVVAVYTKMSGVIIESYDVVIGVKETLTDKNGEFRIPSYTTVIQPLSWESMANFIIYKPGYGNFPRQQKTPSGIKPKDQEIFFSRDTGSEGELEMWVKKEKRPELEMLKVTFGIVELPKLKTKDERLRAVPGRPTGYRSKELPLLYKAINEERKHFGLGEVK